MSQTSVNRRFYDEVRAALIKKGLTLNSWCRLNSYTRQYVEKCLKFERNGPAAYAVRLRLADETDLPIRDLMQDAA